MTRTKQEASRRNGVRPAMVIFHSRFFSVGNGELLTGLLASIWLFSHHGQDFVQFGVLEF